MSLMRQPVAVVSVLSARVQESHVTPVTPRISCLLSAWPHVALKTPWLDHCPILRHPYPCHEPGFPALLGCPTAGQFDKWTVTGSPRLTPYHLRLTNLSHPTPLRPSVRIWTQDKWLVRLVSFLWMVQSDIDRSHTEAVYSAINRPYIWTYLNVLVCQIKWFL